MDSSKSLIIDSTSKTLKVVLDKNTGEFIFTGRSLPEDAKEFFQPVLSWIKDYFKDPNVTTSVVFDIRYYNSSTSKMILDMLHIFKAEIEKGNNIIISWEYDKDDEEMNQAGSDFADVVVFNRFCLNQFGLLNMILRLDPFCGARTESTVCNG